MCTGAFPEKNPTNEPISPPLLFDGEALSQVLTEEPLREASFSPCHPYLRGSVPTPWPRHPRSRSRYGLSSESGSTLRRARNRVQHPNSPSVREFHLRGL